MYQQFVWASSARPRMESEASQTANTSGPAQQSADADLDEWLSRVGVDSDCWKLWEGQPTSIKQAVRNRGSVAASAMVGLGHRPVAADPGSQGWVPVHLACSAPCHAHCGATREPLAPESSDTVTQ